MTALVLLALGAAPPPVALLRTAAADVALSQAKKIDARWHPDQRDCAGLVRFSVREAYRRIAPERLRTPLFLARSGPTDFADAETLLSYNFQGLGRDQQRLELATGDVLAFRQVREEGDVFHLMMVVAPADKAHSEPHVVYHPGEKDAPVRVGRLSDLMREAPGAWRPVPENSSFLGFYRFKEWS